MCIYIYIYIYREREREMYIRVFWGLLFRSEPRDAQNRTSDHLAVSPLYYTNASFFILGHLSRIGLSGWNESQFGPTPTPTCASPRHCLLLVIVVLVLI